MSSAKVWATVVTALVLIAVSLGSKPGAGVGIEEVSEYKVFKKILRTKNNLMAIFYDGKLSKETNTLFVNVAKATKGKGTFVKVNCNVDKKLCKKFKVSLETPFVVKHFKDGEFHKDYDRQMTETSMSSFVQDPTGDVPWEEEPSAEDVAFLNSPNSLVKALKKDKTGMLVMFYAPWCGHCKRMKPDFQAAAKEVNGKAVMAAMDVNKGVNNPVKKAYNISGFPTLIYFEEGKEKFKFNGRSKSEFVDFLTKPYPRDEPVAPATEKESPWSDEPSEVVHLTDDAFDAFMGEHDSVLVMFYAPWCGHCKKMKPEYVKAAADLKDKGISGKLAAVDVTKERKLGQKFDIKGFPTILYFKGGEKQFDAGDARKKDAIVKFMMDPKEPPPPPPPEKPWSEEDTEVEHLTEETFKPFLKRKKHVLVMFYAPWCGHCKAAKPEFAGAAAEMVENVRARFAAVDCTQEPSVCKAFEVNGYPTFKYFSYYNKEQKDYDGGRKKDDFVAFMTDPQNPPQPKPQPGGEESWADKEGSEYVLHLHDDDYESKLKSAEHALVVFYAPWCGHCKSMKADYAKAAHMLATNRKLSGKSFTIAAIDATVQRKATAALADLKGYPTIKYFKSGQNPQDYSGNRKAQDFHDFLVKKILGNGDKTEL